VQGEENVIGLRIFGDYMNNLQIFQVDIIVNLSMILDLFLFEYHQVQHASTPIGCLKELLNCHWLLLKTCVRIINYFVRPYYRCCRTDCVSFRCSYLSPMSNLFSSPTIIPISDFFLIYSCTCLELFPKVQSMKMHDLAKCDWSLFIKRK
jgi:hypothetical protein